MVKFWAWAVVAGEELVFGGTASELEQPVINILTTKKLEASFFHQYLVIYNIR